MGGKARIDNKKSNVPNYQTRASKDQLCTGSGRHSGKGRGRETAGRMGKIKKKKKKMTPAEAGGQFKLGRKPSLARRPRED